MGWGVSPSVVAVGDVNGDGKLDLIVGVSNNGNNGFFSVLLGNGDGTFQPAATYGTGGFPANSIALADFNQDGKLDIVDTIGANALRLRLGNGDGLFNPAVQYLTFLRPDFVAVGDFDGDGRPDLAVANSGAGDVSILMNNTSGPATHFSVSAPAVVGRARAFNITVKALDQFGGTAVTYGGTVQITSSDLAALLPPNSPLTRGVGTFTVSLSTLGNDAVTGTDTTSPTINGSTNILVEDTSLTQLTTSINPGYFRHDKITYIATVTASSLNTVPTGSVAFYDGLLPLGSSPLIAGTAKLMVPSLRIGSHLITATYAGDSNFVGSSAMLLQKRSPAPFPVP